MHIREITTAIIMLLAVNAASAQTPNASGDIPLAPEYRDNVPFFSARNVPAGWAVYDSLWNHGHWKLQCSQEQFCYMHFKLKATKDYGGQVLHPLQWEKGRVVEHSFAVSIKGGRTRTSFSVPFFSWNGRTFRDDAADYEANGRPALSAVYLVDGTVVATYNYTSKVPLRFSMYGDWEENTRPLLASILSHLYKDNPKEFELRLDMDGKPAIGLVFDASGFKDAFSDMKAERDARKAIAKEGKLQFSSWPDGH